MSGFESDVVDLTSELVGRASENPPGEESAVADFLRERLEESPLPFDVETDDVLDGRPNVVARVGDPAEGSVLLTGHTDVVPANTDDWTADPYELEQRGDRIVGRGTADMKGAIAAKILATEAYFESTSTEIPGEVILAFVVDEEHLGRGTQALVQNVDIAPDAAIIGEPTDLDV